MDGGHHFLQSYPKPRLRLELNNFFECLVKSVVILLKSPDIFQLNKIMYFYVCIK